ncbi:hypothetical protein ES707_05440 [subsurface metagenome]
MLGMNCAALCDSDPKNPQAINPYLKNSSEWKDWNYGWNNWEGGNDEESTKPQSH